MEIVLILKRSSRFLTQRDVSVDFTEQLFVSIGSVTSVLFKIYDRPTKQSTNKPLTNQPPPYQETNMRVHEGYYIANKDKSPRSDWRRSSSLMLSYRTKYAFIL